MNYPDLPPGYYWCATSNQGFAPRVELRKRILWLFHQVIYRSYTKVAVRWPGFEQSDIDHQVSILWTLHKQKLRNKTRKS